jgi:hypothetical protein
MLIRVAREKMARATHLKIGCQDRVYKKIVMMTKRRAKKINK